MKVETKKLKLFLLDSGLISSKEITETEKKIKKTGEDFGDALVSGGKISEDDLRRLEAYILGIPFVGLEKEKIDFAVLSLIPESIARNNNIVAYRKNKDELEVAMLDPEDLAPPDEQQINKIGALPIPRKFASRVWQYCQKRSRVLKGG